MCKSINDGDVVYLRKINNNVDLSDVKKIFEIPDERGEVVVPEECAQNKTICGYIMYKDEYGDFQVVSSEIGVIPMVDFVSADEQEFSKTITADLDMLNNFLQLNIGDSNGDYNHNNTRSTGTSFVNPVNTIVWKATIKNSNGQNVTVNIGQTTMTLYADRLAINRDTTTWNDTSVWVTQWAYRAKIYIQPIWYQSSKYRSLNKLLRVYYTTHPNNPSGGTYGMHLLSFEPDSSYSGQSNLQISFGVDASLSGSGVSGEISMTASYPDILIILRDFSRNNDTHHVRIDFEIGVPTSPKSVNVGSVGIDSGVVAANYRTIPMSMQIGYSAWWFVTQGSQTNGTNVYFSDYIIWKPGESW